LNILSKIGGMDFCFPIPPDKHENHICSEEGSKLLYMVIKDESIKETDEVQ